MGSWASAIGINNAGKAIVEVDGLEDAINQAFAVSRLPQQHFRDATSFDMTALALNPPADEESANAFAAAIIWIAKTILEVR